MRKIRSKLRNNLGESISETLVALLISALALTLLASMISSTLRMVTQSRTKMAEYYSENNAIAASSASPTPGQAAFTVDDSDNLALANEDINLYINESFSSKKVIAYQSATPTVSPSPEPTTEP